MRLPLKNYQREYLAGYLFILPNLVGFLIFSAIPVIASLVLSLYKWDIVRAPEFVGLKNYVDLFHDPLFFKVLGNTAYFVLGTVPIGIVLAILLAVILNSKIGGLTWYRTAYFLPVVSSTVAVSLVWRWLYNPDYGLVNHFLWLAGVDGERLPQWLGSTTWAMPAIIFMSIWKNLGYNMVLFLAGLQGIADHYYEAAEIDGASKTQQFFFITLPLLTPTIFFVFIMSLIGSFQVFQQALIMSEGGPANATNTIVLYLYQNGFLYLKMGYASAMAYILFGIIMLITLIQFMSQKKWVHYE
jgi:multiple sugar transport system permease protein